MSILVLDSGAGGYDLYQNEKRIKQNNSVLFQKYSKINLFRNTAEIY